MISSDTELPRSDILKNLSNAIPLYLIKLHVARRMTVGTAMRRASFPKHSIKTTEGKEADELG